MAKTDKESLDLWITRIRDKEMPIFGQTVQSVINVSGDDDSTAARLAMVVLQDASMTARVLRLVNSIYYNPGSNNISTVSRAVVVLGFHTIRNICLSISLVDSLVSGAVRDKLTHKLAHAIHAAVQAKAIAIAMGDKSPEEVFIASLLYRLGEMAFWCFSGEEGTKLAKLMDQPGYDEAKAEGEMLGFRFSDLTFGLVQEWHLQGLLKETLSNPDKANGRAHSVILSHKLARAAEEHGWESEQVAAITQEMEKLSGLPKNKLVTLLHKNAEEAAEIAGFYGAGKASMIIPVPGKERIEKQPEPPKVSPWPEPDGNLQLKILRELSQSVERKAEFTLIMELVMEGIYRGIGFDRALFALLTPDRKTLYAKFCLGRGHEQLTDRFRFSSVMDPNNLFFMVTEQGDPLWIDERKSSAFTPFLSATIRQGIGPRPFFVAPLMVKQRAIGLIYADRSLSGRELDEESFDSFRHFAKECAMVLSLRLAKH